MATRRGRKKNKAPGRRARHRSAPAPAVERVASAQDPEAEASSPKAFPIVGVGASAGGLEAFTQLLRHLPADTGMGFVFIQHLDPTHVSLLGELLSKATDMPVLQVTEDTMVQPSRVHVIPPNVDMTISRGVLHLEPRTKIRGQHMPVDVFLRSLAEDQQARAIGVILSGTASDGAAGMTAIKAEGGITFAQSEKSAPYGGMPHSAIVAGAVDFVLPPEEIARELAEIGRHPYVHAPRRTEEFLAGSEDLLDRIFAILRGASGVDFLHYKQNTIKRRIRRRMVLHKLERLEDYLQYLQANPPEVQALYEDLLINVTGFFRDPEGFDALKEAIFPDIVKDQLSGGSVRVWVPGCSTGEEAYSIAICLMEFLGDKDPSLSVQIFATDVSDSAIETARAGIYRESIVPDVSPERLRRFFAKADRGYQVSKQVRDMCIFAKQNLTRDPPFSRLDLISCRNVLIYLGATLQKQIIPIFHYALKPRGYLWLGGSETVGGFTELFTAVDRKLRVYAKRPTAVRPSLHFAASDHAVARLDGQKELVRDTQAADVQREADRLVLARYAPASVLVNESMDILQFRGRTGAYLEPSPGQASLNLLRMAREGLALDLRSSVHRARKSGVPFRKEGIRFEANGERTTVDVEVIPLKVHPSEERCFLVIFEQPKTAARPERKAKKAQLEKAEAARDRYGSRLRQELASTREYLQAIIEEQEASNEELKSANEEILSANEELQSTNEELETAKEELQSANEELTTVNEELQNRNIELSQLNDDLSNVLSSVHIPIVILGPDLRIRRFTPMAEKLLNLIPNDVGRRITDIRPNMEIPDLEALILDAMDTVSIHEVAVQDREERWYALRCRPYRTAENKIDGAVLLFVDIDDLRRSLRQLQESESFAHAIVETVRDGLLVLDEGLRVRRANRSFYEMFQVSPADTENRFLYELGHGHWNVAHLLESLRESLAKNSLIEGVEVAAQFPSIGQRTMLLSARRLDREGRSPDMILLAITDVTQRKEAENTVRELWGRLLQTRDEEQRRIARELHDSTTQSLSALGMNLALVSQFTDTLPEEARRAVGESRSLAEQCSIEVHDLASLLHPPLLDEVGLYSAVQWYAESLGRRAGISVNLDVSPDLGRLPREVETTLFRIVQECLTNVQRHSGSPAAWIRIERRPASVELEVRDEGRGMPAQAQAASPEAAARSVGITGMRERVRQFGGRFEIVSGEEGTTVKVSLPLPVASS